MCVRSRVVVTAILGLLAITSCAAEPFTPEDDVASTLPSIVVASNVAVPAAPPTRIVVPAIGMNRAVRTLPASSCPTIDPPTVDDPYWIECRVMPGTDADDTVILAGHAVAGGPGVFNALGSVRVGDQVVVESASGRPVYVVDSVAAHSNTSVPEDAGVQSPVPGRLLLVTCSVVDAGVTGDNLIVSAHLIGSEAAGP